MKVKFSKIERTAGVFVLVAVFTFVASTFVVAVKQGWFSSRLHFKTTFTQGEGLHPGTLVQMSGLRAGTVDSVTLNDDNQIEVSLSVSHEFIKRVRKDSIARVIRPFVIGDKVVEVTVGGKEAPAIKESETIASEETMDVMDFLGGGKLGPYLDTVDSLLKNLQVVAQAFADPKRSQAMVAMFDQALPAMRDFREMSRQMTDKKMLQKSFENVTRLTGDLNTMVPAMQEFTKRLPELSDSSAKTMEQMAVLTTEVNKFLPILAQIAPQLPEASQKSVEALREAVVVLKAMQKSFLLRGAVKDVQEEEAKVREDEATKDKIQKEKASTTDQQNNPELDHKLDQEREPANQ